MEQHPYPDGVGSAPAAGHNGAQMPPTQPVPHAGSQPAPSSSVPAAPAWGTPAPGAPAPGTPAKKLWWTLPKVLVAAALAVLLAGGGGAAIGYSMGKTDGTHQAAQRFQNGRPGGANGQGRRGGGQGQQTAPVTPGNGTNP